MDEGDVKRGLHGWLVEAREGFPGTGSLHLCCGQHPARTRMLEGVPVECLRTVRVGRVGGFRVLPGMPEKGCIKAGPASSLPSPTSPRQPLGPDRPAPLGDQSSFRTQGQSPGRLHPCIRQEASGKCLSPEPQFSYLSKRLCHSPLTPSWGVQKPPGEGCFLGSCSTRPVVGAMGQ